MIVYRNPANYNCITLYKSAVLKMRSRRYSIDSLVSCANSLLHGYVEVVQNNPEIGVEEQIHRYTSSFPVVLSEILATLTSLSLKKYES